MTHKPHVTDHILLTVYHISQAIIFLTIVRLELPSDRLFSISTNDLITFPSERLFMIIHTATT